MVFEWDPGKAARNLEKHRVTFFEAASVSVVYAVRRVGDGEAIRIISSRAASRQASPRAFGPRADRDSPRP
ncbi:MAG: BrnT family toxin [Deltaproteobacteria bacterium]|nr:MAG: BrnT family toxin [Deltaproteobacteria bacterium]